MLNNLIVSLARVNKLPLEDIYILLAWCDCGINETDIAKAPFKDKVEWAIETIKRHKKQYYEYRKESELNNFSFLEFLAMELNKSPSWLIGIASLILLKMEEYYGNEGFNGITR